MKWYALGPDDGDEEHEGGDDADEDALHRCVVGYWVWVSGKVGLEVVTTS